MEGNIVTKRSSRDFRLLPEPLVILKDVIYTIWWMLLRVGRADVYIGLSGLDAACGVIPIPFT